MKIVPQLITLALLLFTTIMHGFKLFSPLPFCVTQADCVLPPGKTSKDICCGFIEYERNGVSMQTITKCL